MLFSCFDYEMETFQRGFQKKILSFNFGPPQMIDRIIGPL